MSNKSGTWRFFSKNNDLSVCNLCNQTKVFERRSSTTYTTTKTSNHRVLTMYWMFEFDRSIDRKIMFARVVRSNEKSFVRHTTICNQFFCMSIVDPIKKIIIFNLQSVQSNLIVISANWKRNCLNKSCTKQTISV